MQEKKVELLAPAGNAEGFYGAIHAGADAVYLGGSRFGARAYADNFTTEELISCIKYAHLWDRKVYLTVNTLVKESEFGELYDYIKPFYEAGLDGVIVQDIGVFAYIREQFPHMELHVSTQMTLTGVHGAAMLRDMGACRIVPARELSLEEIRKIKQETGLAIETFIHGAMCYCYSGQCLFSSILGGRSGNRGRCAQPCRLPYEVQTENAKSGECYPLSLKDMCTIEHIPELIAAGIDSFKIEGRMKKPEYTAGVTAIYRKYIDKHYKNARKYAKQTSENTVPTLKIEASDLKDLSCLYIRSERQDGYYYKHNGKDMVTLDSPAYSGSDEELLAEIRQRYLEQRPKLPIMIYADFRTEEKASVTLVMEELSVTVTGDVVQTASKQPINEENISKQLSKLGDSVFKAEAVEITVSKDAFYPLRAINELRREAVAQLENALIEQNGFPICRESKEKIEIPALENYLGVDCMKNTGNIHLSVRSVEQLAAVEVFCSASPNRGRIARVYLDCDLFAEKTDETLKICRRLAKLCELVMALPYIIRQRDAFFMEQTVFDLLEQNVELFSGVLVRSMEGMGILKSKAYSGKIYTDCGFYMWNRKTLQEWSDTISGFCMPLELKSGEQRKLLGELPCEKIVYGRIPMMLTANCVARTTSGCQKDKGGKQVWLSDRYNKKFPVELNCIHCMNIIYNSVPLSLHSELGKWQNQTDFRLDFTIENKQETSEILAFFTGEATGKPPYGEYTTGHEKRGVE